MTAQLLDLTAYRARGERAIAEVAAAPVRHVPVELLAALACVGVDDLRRVAVPAQRRALRLAR